MTDRPLLMIPGPVEVSPGVLEAFSMAPPGHLSDEVVRALGASLRAMRTLTKAPASAQPLVVAGSGTLGMDLNLANLVGKGEHAVVLDTGFFSQRTVEILRRIGVETTVVSAPVGRVPDPDDVRTGLESAAAKGKVKMLFGTLVDTSTGVRIDAAALARLAREYDALSVFDGVCATGGERFEMEAWDADVVFTGSQKALGLPAGLALAVLGERAVKARDTLPGEPPLYFDWLEWLPVMRAYEAGEARYFATPATNHVMALEVGLAEILGDRFGGLAGIDARVARTESVATGMRRAFEALGLSLVPEPETACANTLSAVRLPDGIAPSALLAGAKARGVLLAGGLHPALKTNSFRVGHMGYALTREDMLERTLRAIAESLAAAGHACSFDRAWAAFSAGRGRE